MSKENVIKAVENISVRRGGNIISKKELVQQDKNTICVFVGLGGLGCKAVNEIKALSDERMTDNDKRFYIALDTCASDMEKLAKIDLEDLNNTQTRGRLTSDERLELYDPSKPFALAEADENMKKWLKAEKFKDVVIKGDGAQATRQIGRVMLFANNNYARVKTEIQKVLTSANSKRQATGANNVRVYVIAGISGGTGSGTIVDVSYIIRNIVSSLGANVFKIMGCLFTPDVQLNDEGIVGHEEKELSLKRNFYAAIKEIDYFYNNKEREKKYVSPQPGEPERKENIFDECRLIGRKSSNGTAVCVNSAEVIKKFAQAVMYEIANIENELEDGFTYRAYVSNIPDAVSEWRRTGVAEGMNLPDWAPFRYSAFGYGSFYIPKNELFAYCANKLVEKLCEQWNQKNISEDELKKKIRSVHLTDGREFASRLFEIAGCDKAFEVDRNLVPTDPFGPGPVIRVDKYISELDDIATSVCAKTSISRYFANARGRDNSKLKQEFTDKIIEMVDNAFADINKGPAYAINLLSSDISTPSWMVYYGEGVLKKLRRIIDTLNTEVANWGKELEIIHDQLIKDAEKLKTFELGQHDQGAILSFVDGYADYAKSVAKKTLLLNSKDYLEDIYSILNEKNHQLFEIYTTTLKYICEELKKDSEYVTDTERKKEGNLTTFTFDVTNFDRNDPVSQKIIRFFDGVIDSKDISNEATNFVTKIFGELKKQTQEQKGEITPEIVEEILHGYFSDTFSLWVNDAIEKFCFIAYSDVDVKPEDVTAIFEDPEKRDEALRRVASDIRVKLAEKTKVLLTSADTARNVENFANYTSVGMISETENINKAIMSENKTTMQKGWSEFVMYKGISGFPLFMLDELREYKKIYDGGNEGAVAGAHLDEVGDDWRNFPEPYSYPAAKLLNEYDDSNDEVTKNDKLKFKDIFDKVTIAKKMGLLKVCGENDYYSLTYKLANSLVDEEQTIYNKLKNSYDCSDNKEDFVTVAIAAGYAVAEPLEVNWHAIDPHYDIIKNKTDVGDENDFGNCIKLFYSNIEWLSKLDNALKTFEVLHKLYCKVVVDSAASDVYGNRMSDLYQAIKFGLITAPDDKTIEISYGAKPEQKLSLKAKLSWQDLDIVTFLYHFFVDVMLTMDEAIYTDFKNYLAVVMDTITELPDISSIKTHINDAISNAKYLGETAKSAQIQNFKTKLSVTVLSYNIPNPCGAMKTDTEIEVVIDNLKNFYTTLRDQLE